jgi:hypothetical protein
MYLVQWSDGRDVVASWSDVAGHPMYEVATVFERTRFGDGFVWVAC